MNLQNLARCVGSTCHDGLLAPGMWDRAWRAPRGVEHPETHPHSQAVVVYAEYSSSTLTPGLQLCKECNRTPLWGPGGRVEHLAICVEHASFQPLPNQPQSCAISNPCRQHPYHPVLIDGIKELLDVRLHHPGIASTLELDGQCVPCVQGANLWAIAIPPAQEVLLIEGFEEPRHGEL